MAATGAYARDVEARVRDFLAPKAHWQRRLWNVGLSLELREVIEAADAVGEGVLSKAALDWLSESARQHVAKDVGVGDPQERRALTTCLKRDLTSGGVPYLRLRQLADEISQAYMTRWAAELRTATQPPGRERAARALAAHLLDAGFGPSNLTKWLETQVSTAGASLDIADLFDEAQALVSGSPAQFTALVPFEVEPTRGRGPIRGVSRPTEWVTSDVAAQWLKANGFADLHLSQRGGLLLEVGARDEEGAVTAIADVIDRFEARVSVGSDSTFVIHDRVYFAGGTSIARRRPRRNVEVHALTRADRAYDLKPVGPIDSALELLAHLETAAPPVAVAAGWSSIESTLVGPGRQGNVVAADRLAALVACSWPRAELTDLAWAKARQKDDALCEELFALETNRDKASRMAGEIASGRPIAVTDPSDVAALRRMTKLIASPYAVLLDVQGHATECLRRLYRVRNLILHGGRVAPVALTATVRTAPPLVGAGMDRVTHAYLVASRHPLEVAARAELEIARAGSSGAPSVVDMLEFA